MEKSATYRALDAMIRQGWFLTRFSELEMHLNTLKKKKQITFAEHQTLLELAQKTSLVQPEHS